MNSLRTVAVLHKNLLGEDFFLGFRDSLPFMLGVMPFGITCGIMGLAAGLSPVEILLMSLLVFAGASQFVSITMLADGVTGWGIIGLTTLLINLRHLLMGASLAPYMTKLPVALQAILAFGMADETYAMTVNHTQQVGYSAGYQLGTNSALYATWALSTAAGVILGGYINNPLTWGLDFAMPATFLALLIPRLVSRISLLVFAVAMVVAVLGAAYLPGKWYIIIACVAASLVGGLLEGADSDEC